MSEKFSVIIDGVRSPIGLKNGEMLGILPDENISRNSPCFEPCHK